MGNLTIACLASSLDGSTLYGLAYGYNSSIPYGELGSDNLAILIRTTPSAPANFGNITWEVVSTILRSSLNYLSGGFRSYGCSISPTGGVFTVLNSDGAPVSDPTSVSRQPMGFRYDPALRSTGTNASLSINGTGWVNLDVSGDYIWPENYVKPEMSLSTVLTFTYADNYLYLVGSNTAYKTTVVVLGLPITDGITIPAEDLPLRNISYTALTSTPSNNCQAAFSVYAGLFQDTYYMVCANPRYIANIGRPSLLFMIPDITDSNATLGDPIHLNNSYNPVSMDFFLPFPGGPSFLKTVNARTTHFNTPMSTSTATDTSEIPFAVLRDNNGMHGMALGGPKAGTPECGNRNAFVLESLDMAPAASSDSGAGSEGVRRLATWLIVLIIVLTLLITGAAIRYFTSHFRRVHSKECDREKGASLSLFQRVITAASRKQQKTRAGGHDSSASILVAGSSPKDSRDVVITMGEAATTPCKSKDEDVLEGLPKEIEEKTDCDHLLNMAEGGGLITDQWKREANEEESSGFETGQKLEAGPEEKKKELPNLQQHPQEQQQQQPWSPFQKHANCHPRQTTVIQEPLLFSTHPRPKVVTSVADEWETKEFKKDTERGRPSPSLAAIVSSTTMLCSTPSMPTIIPWIAIPSAPEPWQEEENASEQPIARLDEPWK